MIVKRWFRIAIYQIKKGYMNVGYQIDKRRL